MTFSEEHFERMKTDITLQRQYYWVVGQKAILRSIESRKNGDLSKAQMEASFGRTVLDNIDKLIIRPGDILGKQSTTA